MNKKNKIILIISIILIAIIALAGATVAYFGWRAEEESTIAVTITGGEGSCELSYDNQLLLEPTSSRAGGRIIKLTASQQLAETAPIVWEMIINEIGGLQDKTFRYEMINNTTGASYGSGNFENITSNNKLIFDNSYEKLEFNKEYEFILYLWVDGTIGNNPLSMADQTLDFDINCVVDGTMRDTTLSHSGIIPEGGTYITGIVGGYKEDETGTTIWQWDYSNATTYAAGSEFPNTISKGDVYIYGDYEYKYNYFYNKVDYQEGRSLWIDNEEVNNNYDGWGVRPIDESKSNYGAILESINNQEIVSLHSLFYNNYNLKNAPEIPASVIDLSYTFAITGLKTSPTIPNSVIYMNSTFDSSDLTTAPEIPSSVTSMWSTFAYCVDLTGTVKINSSNITKADLIFEMIENDIIVEVPEGSTTFNTFSAANLPSNITLKTFTTN